MALPLSNIAGLFLILFDFVFFCMFLFCIVFFQIFCIQPIFLQLNYILSISDVNAMGTLLLYSFSMS